MAIKKCKECGEEISSSAKKCPKCGKDQRNFYMRHCVLYTIIILVILVIALASGGDSENTSKTTLTSDDTTSTSSDTTDTSSTANSETVYNVGDIYEDNYIAIKYVSIDENFTNYSAYADVKSGYKIIKAEFEFENVGSSDQYVSAYEFDCYADGYDCESFWSVDDSGFYSTLSAGKKTKGNVYFEVPQDATEIIIEYVNNAWTSDRIQFIVK